MNLNHRAGRAICPHDNEEFTASCEAPRRYLRRRAAAQYVEERWGLPCQPSWLAKLAVVGGGPIFRKCGRFPVYEEAALDDWARSRPSAPMRSTSEATLKQKPRGARSAAKKSDH